MKANYNYNPKKRGKVYRVINIFITMAFLFNMSATQGLLLASPAQAVKPTDNGQDKYTLCHATSSDTNPWRRINVAEAALSAHLDEHGSPLAGHEDDVFLGLDNEDVLECPEPTPPICSEVSDDWNTLLDKVDIGDNTSELLHPITGWSDANIPGGYGGCANGAVCDYRQIIEDPCTESERGATTILHADTNTVDSITVRHLDGVSLNDSFEVWVNSQNVATWDDNTQISSEFWTTTLFDVSSYEFSGDLTVELVATDAIWGSCSTYGQVAIDWISLQGCGDTWEAPYCGDGKINQDSEQCDDGNNDDGDGCSAICETETPEMFDIRGSKWNDENNNGEWDKKEAPLSGWGITLDGNDPVYTNDSGEYWFLNVPAGEHEVCEVQKEGWKQTYPSDNEGCHLINLGGETKTDDSESVYNFGNHRISKSTIVAHKIVCSDESDLPNWGTGGPNITSSTAQDFVNNHENCWLEEGWDFQWRVNGGLPYNTTPADNYGEAGGDWNTFGPTDVNGMTSVELDLDMAKKFWLREVWQDGFIPFTYNIEGNNSDDVSAEFYCKKDVLNYDNLEWVNNMKPDGTYYCVAFNVQEVGSITGRKYQDVNMNGDFDQAEKDEVGDPNRLNDWEISLYDTNWNLVQTQITGADSTVLKGQYRFENVIPGTYNVCEENRTDMGWIQSEPASGPMHDNLYCHEVTVNAGDDVVGIQFGNYQAFDLHGYKWNDLNGDGIRNCDLPEDAGVAALGNIDPECEPLLDGWTINLYEGRNSDPLMTMDTSDLSEHYGWYWFEDLPAGMYRICEEDRMGWNQTYPESGCYLITLPDSNPNALRVSENAVEGPEYNFGNQYAGYCGDGIVNGDEICDGEAGTPEHYSCVMEGEKQCQLLTEHEHTTVSGYKYEDLNGNGQWDEFEQPLNNWEICNTFDGERKLPQDGGKIIEGRITSTPLLNINSSVEVIVEIDEPREPTTECVLTGSGEWEPGYYEFKYYMPVHSSLSETMQEGYTKTQPVEDTYEVEMNEPIDYRGYNFGNQPDFGVSIEKTADTDLVEPDQTFNYSIDWEVYGIITADEVVITDTLPTEVGFVSATNGGVYDSGTHTVTWTLYDVAPGTSGVYGIEVQTSSDVVNDQELVNNVEIVGTEYFVEEELFEEALLDASILGTNVVTQIARSATADATVTATVENGDPLLQITKDSSVSTAGSGETLTYTVVVTNVGAVEAINAKVDDTLPEGLTFVDGGGNTKTFELGDIAIGESMTLTYDVNISDTATTGFYKNIAEVYAENFGKVSADASVEVEAPIVLGDTTIAELVVEKSADVEYTNPGGMVEYTVVVTNNGTEDAQNVLLTDNLPEGFAFEGTTNSVNVWEFSTIAVGSSETVTYMVSVDANAPEGMYDNIALANADNSEENADSATVEVRNISVLGDLVETGSTYRDYILYILGISLVSYGIWYFTREKKLARSK